VFYDPGQQFLPAVQDVAPAYHSQGGGQAAGAAPASVSRRSRGASVRSSGQLQVAPGVPRVGCRVFQTCFKQVRLCLAVLRGAAIAQWAAAGVPAWVCGVGGAFGPRRTGSVLAGRPISQRQCRGKVGAAAAVAEPLVRRCAELGLLG